ncbi:hypothetical protein ACFY41_29635 [Streptomyces syringium]
MAYISLVAVELTMAQVHSGQALRLAKKVPRLAASGPPPVAGNCWT